MRKKDIITKKVLGVRQQAFYDPHYGCKMVAVKAILFTDGTVMHLHAKESNNEPYVTVTVEKNKRKK